MDAHAGAGNCISHVFPFTNQILRAPGNLIFLGNIGYQSQDAIVGAVYAHKGTKKNQCHGLHGFALDQPIGRKQSET